MIENLVKSVIQLRIASHALPRCIETTEMLQKLKSIAVISQQLDQRRRL
jgi:hypothetical protein